MASQICLALSNHIYPTHECSSSTKTHFSISIKKPFILAQNNNVERGSHSNLDLGTVRASLCLSKRELNIASIALLLDGLCAKISKALSNEGMELERYTDFNAGFTLLRPASWIKVDKAGATVLFEEPNKGANNVGVVVSPVRLTSLGEFGTPQFVAEKLIEAEKRKVILSINAGSFHEQVFCEIAADYDCSTGFSLRG